MLSTFTSLSLPSYYCETGSPVEAESTGCKAQKLRLHGALQPQLPHISPLSGCYRPSTASEFVAESAQASAGLRLKQPILAATQHDQAHLAAGSVFGSKPLRPGALRLLTEAAAANGPPPRETHMLSGGGMKNPTFLNMKKGAHVRHARMRRSLLPTEFGSGTGYRILENTMPIRNLLRDVAKLDQFRANGTIEGVHKVTMPVSGCPAKERTLRTERDDESLVIETVGSYSTQEGGKGRYRFSEASWRPVTAPETRAVAHAFAAAFSGSRDSKMHTLPQVAGIRVTGDATESPELRTACSSGASVLQRPCTSAAVLTANSGVMGETSERRPLTGEGSSVHATALRQLEREQMQQAGRYFRPSTRDHSGYANFKPTRGNMLMVFARMDEDQNGIITEAEFLAVMVDLGITVEEAQSLFCRLDKHNNGFIRLRDWGACDSSLKPAIEKLTTQYMRKHLALPSPVLSSPEAMDEYSMKNRAQEVSTLRQVKTLAAIYTFQHGSQAKITGEHPIAEAIKFVDEDGSGLVGREQILDALSAVGVSMKPELADTLMKCCGAHPESRVRISDLLGML